MAWLLAIALAPQVDEKTEALLRKVFAAEHPAQSERAAAELKAVGPHVVEIVRERLRKKVNDDPVLESPFVLVRRLDAAALLDLLAYGPDAVDAVEAALAVADGPRKDLLLRVNARLKLEEPRGSASSARPWSALLPLLLPSAKEDDLPTLIRFLRQADPSSRSEILGRLHHLPLSKAAAVLLLDEADVRPRSVGMPVRKLLTGLVFPQDHDWERSLKSEGPISKAVAALRLQREDAFLEASRAGAPTTRRILIEELSTFPVAERRKEAFALAVLKERVKDPDPQIRTSAELTLSRMNLRDPDLSLDLLIGQDASHRKFKAESMMRKGEIPSEKALGALVESGQAELLSFFCPGLTPASHPNLKDALISALKSVDGEAATRVYYALARYGHPEGLARMEADLLSRDLLPVLTALEEVARCRMETFLDKAAALTAHPNAEVVKSARVAVVLLGARTRKADVLRFLEEDAWVRSIAFKELQQKPLAADLPLIELLARSRDQSHQSTALYAVERMTPPPLELLAILRESTHESIRDRALHRVRSLSPELGIMELFKDLGSDSKDIRFRASGALSSPSALEPFRFRVVDGPLAIQDKTIDIPSPLLKTLNRTSSELARVILTKTLPGPLPDSFLEIPGDLSEAREFITRVVARRDPEDIRRVYARGVGAVDPEPWLKSAWSARDIEPDGVDEFLRKWLSPPPPGAREESVRQVLSYPAAFWAAPSVKELLVSLILDERPEVHGPAIQLLKSRKALGQPETAARLWREGRLKDKARLLPLLASSRSPEGEALLREWMKNDAAAGRARAAEALVSLIGADAIPELGPVLFDLFALRAWDVLPSLAKGIGVRHQKALENLYEGAEVEQRGLLDVLLFLSGKDDLKDRFVAKVPDGAARGLFVSAYTARELPPDDTVLERLIQDDPRLEAINPSLSALCVSDTRRAAELALTLLTRALEGGRAERVVVAGPACVLIGKHLGERAVAIVGTYAKDSEFGGSDAVRALTLIGGESAVQKLLEVAGRSRVPAARVAASEALRSAHKYPALIEDLCSSLKGLGMTFSGDDKGLGFVAQSPYLEGSARAVEPLIEIMAQKGNDPAIALCALGVLLTIPGSEDRIESRLELLRRENAESSLHEFYHAVVKGQRVTPRPGLSSDYALVIHAHHRNRSSVLLQLPYMQRYGVRALQPIEIVANRSLEGWEGINRWMRAPGPLLTADVMAEELRALGYPDPKKALRDPRGFVRSNAAWLLRTRAGKPLTSRGPWVGVQSLYGQPAIRWTLPPPTDEEIKELER